MFHFGVLGDTVAAHGTNMNFPLRHSAQGGSRFNIRVTYPSLLPHCASFLCHMWPRDQQPLQLASSKVAATTSTSTTTESSSGCSLIHSHSTSRFACTHAPHTNDCHERPVVKSCTRTPATKHTVLVLCTGWGTGEPTTQHNTTQLLNNYTQLSWRSVRATSCR